MKNRHNHVWHLYLNIIYYLQMIFVYGNILNFLLFILICLNLSDTLD